MFGAATYLHSSEERLLVSGGNHGLGNTQSAVLAAVKYVGCQLLREALDEAIAKYGKPEIMNTDSHMMVTSSWVI